MNDRQTTFDDDAWDARPPGPVYRVDVPADFERIPAILEEIVRRGAEAGFPQDRLRFNLRVGVCEALSNAIRHGERSGRGSVRVEAAFSAATIEIRIADSGGGFDPDEVPDPTLPENLSRPGGRGVFLIQKLMDHVEYNDVGNALRMVLHAPADDADGAV